MTGEIHVVVAPARRFVVVHQRQLAFSDRESDRESARGTRVAEQDTSYRMTTFLTGVPRVQHGTDAVDPL